MGGMTFTADVSNILLSLAGLLLIVFLSAFDQLKGWRFILAFASSVVGALSVFIGLNTLLMSFVVALPLLFITLLKWHFKEGAATPYIQLFAAGALQTFSYRYGFEHVDQGALAFGSWVVALVLVCLAVDALEGELSQERLPKHKRAAPAG